MTVTLEFNIFNIFEPVGRQTNICVATARWFLVWLLFDCKLKQTRDKLGWVGTTCYGLGWVGLQTTLTQHDFKHIVNWFINCMAQWQLLINFTWTQTKELPDNSLIHCKSKTVKTSLGLFSFGDYGCFGMTQDGVGWLGMLGWLNDSMTWVHSGSLGMTCNGLDDSNDSGWLGWLGMTRDDLGWCGMT